MEIRFVLGEFFNVLIGLKINKTLSKEKLQKISKTILITGLSIAALLISLGINKRLEIEDKYLNITPNDIYRMVFTKNIKEHKTKVILKENQ